MASQHRIQAYMDKHKLEALFEDLMNKVLRDMPEEPHIYILRAMYKKTGMEIPQDIRFGGMKKSTEFIRSRTPERNRRPPVSQSADDGLKREYEKPWQTSPTMSRRTRMKSDDTKTGQKRSTKSTEWNPDVRVKSTSFDDLWEDQSQPRKDVPVAKKRDPSPDKRSSWASIGFGSEKINVFSSNNYRGPRTLRTEEDDPLANELRPVTSSQTEATEVSNGSTGHIRGPRVDAKRHRQELEQLVKGSDVSNDSGYEDKTGLSDEDEALELLEDAEELKKEGARHISEAGYRLSRISRQRNVEPKVKLNINPLVMSAGKSVGYGIDDSDTEDRPQTGRRTVVESDEEFESVSQVTGPREPVWKLRDAQDSDAETYTVKVQPVSARSNRHGNKKVSMAATLPLRSSGATEGEMRGGTSTWTGGLGSERGGWELPDDSDGSHTDFTDTTRSKLSRDPRVY